MNNQSEQINELASALAKAQGEMRAADKNCVNPHFKNRFADLSSIWDAIREPLAKNGLSIMQYVDAMEGRGQVLVTMLTHGSGQWIKSILPLLMTKQDCQGFGSSLSYMRRYGLSALVGVVSDDEEDGNEAAGVIKANATHKKTVSNVKEPIPAKVEMLSTEQIIEISEAMNQCDDKWHENAKEFMKKTWNADKVADLPAQAYKPMMTSIQRNIEMNAKEK